MNTHRIELLIATYVAATRAALIAREIDRAIATTCAGPAR